MSERVTPDEVMTEGVEGLDLPDGTIITAAILLVEYDRPDLGRRTVWRRDTETPIWTHLGMVMNVKGDLEHDLLQARVEE